MLKSGLQGLAKPFYRDQMDSCTPGNALFVIGGEGPPLGLGHDFGIGARVCFGADSAASGATVALASLGLPTHHRWQNRWRRRGNLMAVHYVRDLSRPAL